MVNREDALNKINIKNISLMIREKSLLVKENLRFKFKFKFFQLGSSSSMLKETTKKP